MTRAEAKAASMKRYLLGRPCPHGHNAERYVSTGSCVVCLAEKAAAWREEHREHVLRYARDRYWQNPESRNEATRRWFAANPDRAKALRTEWHARNPLSRRLHEAKRRAKKSGTVTALELAGILSAQRGRCAYCRAPIRKTFHADHIVPLARGGAHHRRNIQMLCQTCNQKKHAKDPITYARQIGALI